MRTKLSLTFAFVAMAAFGTMMLSSVQAQEAPAKDSVQGAEPKPVAAEAGEKGEAKTSQKAAAAVKLHAASKAAAAEVKAIVSAAAKKGNAAIGAIEDKTSPEGIAERTKIIADFNKLRDSENKKAKAKQDAFIKAFKEVPFKDWDLAVDKTLVQEGLFSQAMDEKDDKKKLALFEMILDKVPGGSQDGNITGYYLPNLLLGLDDYKLAKSKLVALGKKATADKVSSIALQLGNLDMMWGNYDAAQKSWAAGLEALPPIKGQRDPNARTKGDLEARIALIGKTAPEIDSDNWLGGKAKPLSKMTGGIVIVDFWATWCPPCVRSMPGLNDLRNEFVKKGVEVLGVTKVYASGRIPESMDALRKGNIGDSIRGIAAEDFQAHVQKFRDNTKCDYPFVIVKGEESKAYKVRGIPTMAIINAEGKVASYFVGGGNESKIKAVVERLLEKKDGAKKDAPKEGEKGADKEEAPSMD